MTSVSQHTYLLVKIAVLTDCGEPGKPAPIETTRTAVMTAGNYGVSTGMLEKIVFWHYESVNLNVETYE